MQNPNPESEHEDLRPLDSVILVERAKAGDRRALEQLLLRHQDRILRIARIRLGSKLRRFLDSTDIVNQTNAVVARTIQDFERADDASVIQWLSRIVENQIRDAHSHHTRRKRDMNLDVRGEADSTATSGEGPIAICRADDTTPPDAAERAERKAIIDECLEELDEDHREVILLRDISGGSWSFVCSAMGRANVHATQELHRRARMKLGALSGSAG